MTNLQQGDRIELIAMPDDPCPIEPGTKGRVQQVVPLQMGTPQEQVWVNWDNGRRLSLVVPPDEFKRIGGGT